MSDPLQSLFSRCDSVLVFDTETSGLSWQRDEIIEFSAIRLTASGTEEVDEFVRCTRSLPPRIVELTGITDDLLREEGIGKQAFAELLAALLTPGTMLAAYNAQFDLLFLYAFLQKYGDAACCRTSRSSTCSRSTETAAPIRTACATPSSSMTCRTA